MKQPIFLLALMLSVSAYVYSQAEGSLYTFQLGKKTAIFKYSEKPETVKEISSEDGPLNPFPPKHKGTASQDQMWERTITGKHLTLQDNSAKSIDIKHPWRIDTINIIDPVSEKGNTKIVSNSSVDYHIETEMSYTDFLLLLKTKFELHNTQKSFRVYSYDIYYETASQGGMIKIRYPQTSEGVISKLNCLDKGGFILLSLRAADHDNVSIDNQGRFLALIHIKN